MKGSGEDARQGGEPVGDSKVHAGGQDHAYAAAGQQSHLRTPANTRLGRVACDAFVMGTCSTNGQGNGMGLSFSVSPGKELGGAVRPGLCREYGSWDLVPR